MAGPGGGPPRKSHTKSKKGCKTCKKRHIRCDENFPQCRNCTKHNVRCDYQDQPAATEDPGNAVASAYAPGSNPELEVEQWIQTGVFPFPELGVPNTNQFIGLTKNDLRLIHYLCNAYRQLYQKGAVYCAPWIAQLPVFLEISGRGHRCVLSALLALAALRMAAGNNAQEMANLADIYRTHALRTTQEALGDFSQENADSILATSIILSWQVDDLASWNSLMQGISTVINHMGDWKFDSPIASFAESYVLARPTPMIGNEHSISHSITAMQQFAEVTPKEGPLDISMQHCCQAAMEISSASRTMTAPQIFSKLAFLRSRVLWAPFDYFLTMGVTDLPLIAIAHCFATACAVDSALPELNGACLGALTPSAIDQIDSSLRYGPQSSLPIPDQATTLMQFPRHMTLRFSHLTSSAENMFSSFAQPHSPYAPEGIDVHSNPGTPPYPPTMHYMGSPDLSEISMPPSPYLAGYGAPSTSSHRLSGQYATTPRPGSIYSDRGSLNVPLSQESPRYSPSYSPQPDTPAFFPYASEQVESPPPMSAGFPSGSVSSEIWA